MTRLNPKLLRRIPTLINYTSLSLVKEDDLLELQKIGMQTFSEAFSGDNSAANMEAYLKEKFSLPHLKAELRTPGSLFYFAEANQSMIGYLKVNICQSQKENILPPSLEIERIYVLAAYHGKGVGKRLFDQAINIAKQENLKVIWLGVWEENPRAIRFYKKNGFVEFSKHRFLLGDEEQMDLLMKLDLENA